MDLGYDGTLFILAFDHRASFGAKMFGIDGPANPEQQATLETAKQIIWEGFVKAIESGKAPIQKAGVLVDEETGAGVARAAKELGVVLAMPVEQSGKAVFDFEYGEEFGSHIEAFDPTFTKVLVRWNPDDEAGIKKTQIERLSLLIDWLRQTGRKLIFELLVPASDRQLALVGDDVAAYDSVLRPTYMLETIEELYAAGIEPDIWKIEGIDGETACSHLAAYARSNGHDGVRCVVLGRGADLDRVRSWLRTAAPIEGYSGFAIGRSIWWRPLEQWRDAELSREQAALAIADRYADFISVYEAAGGGAM